MNINHNFWLNLIVVYTNRWHTRNSSLPKALILTATFNCTYNINTFHRRDEGGTVSGTIPTSLHAVSSTRLVMPLAAAIVVIVITENSCNAHNLFAFV